MRERTEGFTFDLNNWREETLKQVIQGAASGTREATLGELEERINPGIAKISEFGRLVKTESLLPEDIATKRVYDWALGDTPSIKISTKDIDFDQEVYKALADFINLNSHSMVLWISPPKKGVYPESRLVFYQTVEINGEKHLFYRALCGRQTQKDCLLLARKLFSSFETERCLPITDPEDLRATPLLFQINSQRPWTDVFSEFIDMPQVWQAIRNGEDLKGKIKAMEVAGLVIGKYIDEIRRGQNQVYWGTRIEEDLQQGLGIKLQSGACGILYSSLTPLNWATIIPLGISSPSLEKKSRKFIKNCGACGRELNRYMSEGDICPYCKGIYKGC